MSDSERSKERGFEDYPIQNDEIFVDKPVHDAKRNTLHYTSELPKYINEVRAKRIRSTSAHEIEEYL